MYSRASRTTIADMTNESLTSAIAAERRRDMIAAAQHARLVREATTPPAAPTPATARAACSAVASPPPDVADELRYQTAQVHPEPELLGIALLAGPANVVMQLARPPVGHGVVESTVESGQLFRHPLKRARTTFTYLAVALHGTDTERRAYRRAVDTVHAAVRSTPSSPVAYSAFDPDLQLWVAGCLYRGIVDTRTAFLGPDDPATAERVYAASAALATTLQVPAAPLAGRSRRLRALVGRRAHRRRDRRDRPLLPRRPRRPAVPAAPGLRAVRARPPVRDHRLPAAAVPRRAAPGLGSAPAAAVRPPHRGRPCRGAPVAA